jgi:hypothetical protein
MEVLCADCVDMRDSSIRVPRHLVHPEHGKPDTRDVRGEAVCPTCSTRWRAKRDNTFEIIVA